jgi:GTPase SAR1 family protein
VGYRYTYSHPIYKIPKLPLLYIAGTEKYRAITTGHYRNAVGAVLVYDISSEESFFNLGYWLENLREAADDHCVIALMPNKCDIMFRRPEDREVMKEQG